MASASAARRGSYGRPARSPTVSRIVRGTHVLEADEVDLRDERLLRHDEPQRHRTAGSVGSGVDEDLTSRN
jgi:hypothetical protein